MYDIFKKRYKYEEFINTSDGRYYIKPHNPVFLNIKLNAIH